MKKILLMTMLSLCLFFSLNAQAFQGKGADSPEKAVSEYLNSLKSCDYNQIISCYAIESFVECYDINQYIEKMSCANISMKMIYPNDGLLKQTAVFEILDSIIRTVKYQIWNLCDKDFFKEGNLIMLQYSTEDVINKVFPCNAEERLSSLKFQDFISEEEFLIYLYTGFFTSDPSIYEDEIYEQKENLDRYHEKTRKIYGCDDIQDVSASFFIEGEKYFIFAETLKYGDKWYLSPNQGFLANSLGMSASSGYIASAEELWFW